MIHLHLPKIGTFDAWRAQARALAAARVPADDVAWTRGDGDGGLFDGETIPEGHAPVTVPKDYVGLARTALHHSDRERFALAYSVLMRLQDDKSLLEMRTDDQLTRLRRIEKAVRRDVHKVHAFVRFREVDAEGRRKFVAWFEPEHPCLEIAAPHFATRFTDMDWVIATPDLTAVFEEGTMILTEDGPKAPPPEDDTQALWNTYYSNIFNPARLKVKAMQAEMPKKYWRNLPEARLIPDLIANAHARSLEMQEKAPTLPPARAARITERLREQQEKPMDLFGHNSLAALKADAEGCTRCPLHLNATQLVFGEGPTDADIMVVGEQPGDKEDLAGRPFVGPAGQLFDEIAGRAGLDRGRVYVTNAVKHFKYEVRGKRRLHKSPAISEINQCRWWLDQERALVEPKMIIAMGGSAVHALTGDKAGVLKRRGTVERAKGGAGEPVFITVHPSFLLRLPDPEARKTEEQRFENDLRAALDWLEQEAA